MLNTTMDMFTLKQELGGGGGKIAYCTKRAEFQELGGEGDGLAYCTKRAEGLKDTKIQTKVNPVHTSTEL